MGTVYGSLDRPQNSSALEDLNESYCRSVPAANGATESATEPLVRRGGSAPPFLMRCLRNGGALFKRPQQWRVVCANPERDKLIIRAHGLHKAALPRCQDLYWKGREVSEYPQQIEALGKSWSEISRPEWSQHSEHA